MTTRNSQKSARSTVIVHSKYTGDMTFWEFLPAVCWLVRRRWCCCIQRGGGGLPTVGEDDDSNGYGHDLKEHTCSLSHTHTEARGKVRGGKQVGPLAGKIAEDLRAKGETQVCRVWEFTYRTCSGIHTDFWHPTHTTHACADLRAKGQAQACMAGEYTPDTMQ